MSALPFWAAARVEGAASGHLAFLASKTRVELRGNSPSTGTPAVVQSRPTHKLVLAGKDHWSPTQAVGLVPQHQAHRKRGAPQEGRPAIGEISVRPGLE